MNEKNERRLGVGRQGVRWGPSKGPNEHMQRARCQMNMCNEGQNQTGRTSSAPPANSAAAQALLLGGAHPLAAPMVAAEQGRAPHRRRMDCGPASAAHYR